MNNIKRPGSSWLSFPDSNADADFRLFCLPYAGGGAAIFYPWQDKLSPRIEICTVNLPGRGTRFADKPYHDHKALIKELADAIIHFLDKPYALFGHSMGAILVYELAQELRRRKLPQAVHLFVSGRRAVHIAAQSEPLYGLTDNDLIARLKKLNGTPDEVLQNRELLSLILPAIRADFKLCDSYQYNEESQKLSVDITAFEGEHDHNAQGEEVSAWQELTLGSFQSRQLAGDHFFIHSSEQQLLELIADEMLNRNENISSRR